MPKNTAKGSSATSRVLRAETVTPAPPTPMDILNNAITRGASGADIDKFINLVKDQRELEARQGFIGAMIDFKKEVPEICRNASGEKFVEGQEVAWDYATLDRVCDHLIPALAKHDIIHHWQPDQSGVDASLVTITAILTHRLGHSQGATLKAPPDASDGKTPVEAIQSTTTRLERYTLLAVCGVAVKQQRDDEAGRNGNEPEAKRSKASETLLRAAQAEADHGHIRFALYWRNLSPQERKVLGNDLAWLEGRANAADSVGRQ